MREWIEMHRATVVRIGDKPSGTELIHGLFHEGLQIVKAVKPEGDKVMSFNAETAAIAPPVREETLSGIASSGSR